MHENLHFYKRNFLLLLAAFCLIVFLLFTYILFAYRQAIPVLNYHQINDQDNNLLTVRTEQFAAQMNYLEKAGYHTLTADELADAMENKQPLPENSILITFDDGYADNYKNAYPILKEHQMKATIFLISDYIDRYPKYLTWAEAREMQKNHIDFESHTLNHVELNQTVPPAEKKQQIQDSKLAIEWQLKRPVNFIAYPCGTYSPDVIQIVKDAGYRGAFTVQYGLARLDKSPYTLDRIPIFGNNSHTLLRFKLRLTFTPLFSILGQLRAHLAQTHPGIVHYLPLP